VYGIPHPDGYYDVIPDSLILLRHRLLPFGIQRNPRIFPARLRVDINRNVPFLAYGKSGNRGCYEFRRTARAVPDERTNFNDAARFEVFVHRVRGVTARVLARGLSDDQKLLDSVHRSGSQRSNTGDSIFFQQPYFSRRVPITHGLVIPFRPR